MAGEGGSNCGAGVPPASERHAGKMPAPQGAGKMAAPQSAGKMPAPQELAGLAEPPLNLGSCVLRQPALAQIVQEALLFFEGQRYLLSAWCVMPNHVHVVVTPLPPYRLAAIVHSWKSYTAKKINSCLRRSGTLWERECFDHLIRTEEYWEAFVRYTEGNAVAAGLCAKPEDWPFGSRGMGFQRSVKLEFVDPRRTPLAPMRSRGELPHLEKEAGTYFITFRLYDAVNCGAGVPPAQ